jgi:sugar phosphate isomerase/epimerase
LNNSLTRRDFSLLNLPGLTAQHGLGKLEVCHFHLASTDAGYLGDLKNACIDAGVTFFTFLKDNGDITHPDPAQREREIQHIEHAIDIAAACGAQRIRVIAGDAEPSTEALKLSASGLLRLADYGADRGVRVVTENWHRLLDRSAAVVELMERTEGKVGLKLDFGNWSASRKFDDLPKIARYAECTHAKAEFPQPGVIDETDFARCLDICQSADFAGPHILIFASPGDEWSSLDIMRDIVAPYVS